MLRFKAPFSCRPLSNCTRGVNKIEGQASVSSRELANRTGGVNKVEDHLGSRVGPQSCFFVATLLLLFRV